MEALTGERTSPALLLDRVMQGVRAGALSVIAVRAAPALLTLALARIAGPGPLGIVAYSLSLLSLTSALADIGLPFSLPRWINREDPSSDVAITALGVRLLTSLVIGFVLLAIGTGIDGRGFDALIAGTLVLMTFDLVPQVLNATLRFPDAARRQIVASSVFLIGGVTAAALGVPTVGPLAARATGSVAAGLGRVVAWLRGGARFRRPIAVQLLTYGVVAMIPSLMSVVFNQADVILVTRLLGYDAAGIYKTAATVATVPAILSSILATPLQPVIAAHTGQPNAVVDLVIGVVDVLLIVAACIFAIGAAAAGPVLHTLAGATYTAGAGPFVFLLGGNLLGLLSTPLMSLLFMTGRAGVVASIATLSAIASVILNLLLIPRFGLVGGGVASLLCYSLGFTIQLIFICGRAGRWPDPRNAALAALLGIGAYLAARGAIRVVPAGAPALAVAVATLAGVVVLGLVLAMRPARGAVSFGSVLRAFLGRPLIP